MPTHTPKSDLPVALTIAGSDSGAGAGIQADLLTFAANGVFGTTAITCLTAQNPKGISCVRPCTPYFVFQQCMQVSDYFRPKALKTGMLFNTKIALKVVDFITYSGITSVIDPVMVASSGATLLTPAAITTISRKLLPLAALVTPNLDEASLLLGRKVAGTVAEATELTKMFGVPFLLKGGHAQENIISDVLAWPSGETEIFAAKRATGIDTHGSGCTLAAAITAQLAKGKSLRDAVALAHAYLQGCIHNPIQVAGCNFMSHLVSGR